MCYTNYINRPNVIITKTTTVLILQRNYSYLVLLCNYYRTFNKRVSVLPYFMQ